MEVGLVGVVAALDEVEAVLVTGPALGQVEEALDERVLLVGRQSLDEDVEQVEHGQYNVVDRLEQRGQVLNGVEEVARLRVFDEQRRELKHGQQEQLELLDELLAVVRLL